MQSWKGPRGLLSPGPAQHHLQESYHMPESVVQTFLKFCQAGSGTPSLKVKLGVLCTISVLEFHRTTDQIHTFTLRNFIPNSWK